MQCLVIICVLESCITICSCVIILNVFGFKHLGTVTPAVRKVTICYIITLVLVFTNYFNITKLVLIILN